MTRLRGAEDAAAGCRYVPVQGAVSRPPGGVTRTIATRFDLPVTPS
jgi:hypothetical protein